MQKHSFVSPGLAPQVPSSGCPLLKNVHGVVLHWPATAPGAKPQAATNIASPAISNIQCRIGFIFSFRATFNGQHRQSGHMDFFSSYPWQ